MYTHDGYMCANLVNPDRPKWADVIHPTLEEKAAVADGSFAYCGRFEIDAVKKQIIHLPEVSSRPDYSGTRQIRPFSFENGRMVLSGVETEEPGAVRWKIVWGESAMKNIMTRRDALKLGTGVAMSAAAAPLLSSPMFAMPAPTDDICFMRAVDLIEAQRKKTFLA